MKIYYMRDNHTFLPLPLDADAADALLRKEFTRGYSYGMLCGRPLPSLHAKGSDEAEAFFREARQWILRAIEHANPAGETE